MCVVCNILDCINERRTHPTIINGVAYQYSLLPVHVIAVDVVIGDAQSMIVLDQRGNQWFVPHTLIGRPRMVTHPHASVAVH